MSAFRKKPVVIEATQWFKNGDHPEDRFSRDGVLPEGYEGGIVRYFRHPDVPGHKPCEQCGQAHHVHGWIDTLEQGHRVCPGDWIITGVKGEHYPCKPDIFAMTYEPADQPAPQGVAEVMEIARRLTFADTESVLSAETEGWWAKHDKACAIARELEHAVTALITERDTLRARVAELEKDAERYQFWRNRWGDEQFLSTLAGTIRQLSDPLIRGDYNNLDIVSDAAIAAAKEPK